MTLTSVTDDGHRYGVKGSGRETIKWIAQGELSDGTTIPVTLWFPEDQDFIEAGGYTTQFWKRTGHTKIYLPVLLEDRGNEWRISELQTLRLTWLKRDEVKRTA